MSPSTRPLRCIAALSLGVCVLAAHPVLAHQGEAPSRSAAAHPNASAQQTPWGIAGRSGRATRVIRIEMSDAMRFTPDRVEVRLGETVRFELHNVGKTLHEMVLGTLPALEEHAAMMEKYPGMEHDEPHMAHVPPGGRAEIVWKFNRRGDFMFGCLLPGHWSAGMKGQVKVSVGATSKGAQSK